MYFPHRVYSLLSTLFTANSDNFPLKNKKIALSNVHILSLWGMNRSFVYHLDKCQSLKCWSNFKHKILFFLNALYHLNFLYKLQFLVPFPYFTAQRVTLPSEKYLWRHRDKWILQMCKWSAKLRIKVYPHIADPTKNIIRRLLNLSSGFSQALLRSTRLLMWSAKNISDCAQSLQANVA